MRRHDREITDPSEILDILSRCDILRLGLSDGDYPYIVPVNFAYEYDGQQLLLYIHGAMAGRKYTLLQDNPKCSFELDNPLGIVCAGGSATMRYESIMGTAFAEFLEGAEKERVVDHILMPRYPETRDYPYSKTALPRTAVVRLTVQTLTAKANR